MRNLIYAINVSLDGCCEHTKAAGPQGPAPEIYDYYTNLLREVDLVVYGRVTYQLMVPYWPDVAKDHSKSKAANDFADTFTAINKVVFSRTLEGVDDPQTKIVSGNLQDEILKLKQAPGKDIMIGGVALPSQLIQLGLVDEYRFMVNPILAGEGKRLMEGINLQQKLQLELIDSKVFASASVLLRYRKQ